MAAPRDDCNSSMAVRETNFPSHGDEVQLHQRYFPAEAGATAASGPVRAAGEGRTGRGPVRRRPRAPRRTPTTVLTADAANFRAMVQQFTGAHPAPFQAAGAAAGGGQAAPGFGIQRQPAVFLSGVQQQLHRHVERQLFTEEVGGRSSTAGSGDAFQFQHGYVGDQRRGYVDVSEGVLPESGPPSQMMPRAGRAAAASMDLRTTGGFLF